MHFYAFNLIIHSCHKQIIMMIRNLAKRVLQTRVASKSLSFGFSQESQEKPNENELDLESRRRAYEDMSMNVGINKFLGKVYMTTGLSVLSALSISYTILAMGAHVLPTIIVPLAQGGLLASLVGFIGSSYMKPTYYTQLQKVEKHNFEILKSKNSMMRKALYGTGVIGLGLSAPLFLAIAGIGISPTIISTAIGLSAIIFGGASLMAYYMPPKYKMISFGKPLMVAFMGVTALVGILALYTYQIDVFQKLISFFSIILFNLIFAYDTNVSIKIYKRGQPDHLAITYQNLRCFILQ